MAKNNANGNGTDVTAASVTPPFISLLQGKGGVGKSVIASWLANPHGAAATGAIDRRRSGQSITLAIQSPQCREIGFV